MNERIDLEQVREVVRLAEELDVAELEVQTPMLRVRVARGARGTGGAGTPPALPAAAGAEPIGTGLPAGPDHAGASDHLAPVIAPMVGTFYRAPSPDAPPFVNEGDYVSAGQVICIIEAMKLFNEIQADHSGRVARILVDNASPVEYGQNLFLLDRSASRP